MRTIRLLASAVIVALALGIAFTSQTTSATYGSDMTMISTPALLGAEPAATEITAAKEMAMTATGKVVGHTNVAQEGAEAKTLKASNSTGATVALLKIPTFGHTNAAQEGAIEAKIAVTQKKVAS